MQLFISDSLNPDFYAGMFYKNFLMETRSIRYLIKLNKWHDLHDVIFVFCFFSYHFESIQAAWKSGSGRYLRWYAQGLGDLRSTEVSLEIICREKWTKNSWLNP